MNSTSFQPSSEPDISNEIAERVVDSIRSSERAVLALGDLIDQIVRLAMDSGAKTGDVVLGSEGAFVDQMARVMHATSGFIKETRAFMQRQVEFARTANAAFQSIHKAATGVTNLTVKSRLLALNLKIEAVRGNGERSSLQVVGQEMVEMAKDIRSSSEEIVRSLDNLSHALPSIETAAVAMDKKAEEFSCTMDERLEDIREMVMNLRQAQQQKVHRLEDHNREVVTLANRALSELQFQDPLVQDLHAVLTMLDHPLKDTIRAPVALSAMGITDSARSAGEVELF